MIHLLCCPSCFAFEISSEYCSLYLWCRIISNLVSQQVSFSTWIQVFPASRLFEDSPNRSCAFTFCSWVKMRPWGRGVQFLDAKHCLRFSCSFFPIWTGACTRALHRGGPFTKQPCLKVELLSSGHQTLRKIFQLKIDQVLVIYGNVFSFKHGAGDFSSRTHYGLKHARSLASHKTFNLWLEKFSNLLNVVYILLFVYPLPSQSSLCIRVTNFLSDLSH